MLDRILNERAVENPLGRGSQEDRGISRAVLFLMLADAKPGTADLVTVRRLKFKDFERARHRIQVLLLLTAIFVRFSSEPRFGDNQPSATSSPALHLTLHNHLLTIGGSSHSCPSFPSHRSIAISSHRNSTPQSSCRDHADLIRLNYGHSSSSHEEVRVIVASLVATVALLKPTLQIDSSACDLQFKIWIRTVRR